MPFTLSLRVLPSGALVQVRPGERVLDALDEQLEAGPLGHGLPTACRAANCGACRVIVLGGESLLAPGLPAENALLAELGMPMGGRLGCQLVVVGSHSIPSLEPNLPEIVLEVIPRTAS